ncbi:MAG TPA: 50S ribosomal protein L15 [Candidatus Limnocylindrales bacterium]|nr:50S ribosomal protein L15 [Candidatus Limnocylindrales bacterium]
MKLHDLRPPDGSHTARTRVGRGIAAGKGKTAGRGTKGQKARAGGSIPPWFEGGQTPLHMRIPKLRGFKNRFKVVYEVVNVGAIAQRFDAGAFAEAGSAPKKGEQLTINADILRAVGLVRDVRKPLKVLGGGELSAALFVVADAFTKSATQKIEAAGGAVSVLEVPSETKPALGVGEEGARTAREPRTAAGRAAAERKVDARATRAADAAEREAEATATIDAKAAKTAKAAKPPKAEKAEKAEKADADADAATADAEPVIGDATGADAEPVVDADAVTDEPDAVDPQVPDAAASPLEPADATVGSDDPAADIATETDAADDGENA